MHASESRSQEPLGIGVIGAGNFARFCLDAYQAMSEVRVIGLTDVDEIRARAVAAAYGIRAYADLDALLAEPAVKVVTIQTPPAFHAPIALRALEAGKHVLSEKPLALTLADADRVISLASQRHLLVSLDFVMRPNPLTHSLRRLVQSKLLGDLLHLSLDNDAAAENLGPDHWFWNLAISGGIWIEHGVLFFDLFRHISGHTGILRGSTHMARETGEIDRVSALVDYGDVPASFCHTFKRANCFEHTEIRANFVCGNVTLYGWIPLKMTVDALLEPGERKALLALCPPSSVVTSVETVRDRSQRPAAEKVDLHERVLVTATLKHDKLPIYRSAIQANLRDLVQAILDPAHRLQVTPEQARQALSLAIDATTQSAGPKPPLNQQNTSPVAGTQVPVAG